MSSASGGLRPSDLLTIIVSCRRPPTLLCSLSILNLYDNFVKKLVSEIRKCSQLQRDMVILEDLVSAKDFRVIAKVIILYHCHQWWTGPPGHREKSRWAEPPGPVTFGPLGPLLH